MEKRIKVLMFLGTVLMVLFFSSAKISYATPPDNRPPDNRPPDNRPPDRSLPIGEVNVQTTTNNLSQSQAEATSQAASEASASATFEATAQGGDGGAGGAGGAGGEGYGGQASSSNEGVTVEGDRIENSSTNVVLVPNNNTANCMRVFGLSFGTGDGAAALGYPHRDSACDFEQAADDAAATGNHKIAWWWRCHKKALYKTFKHGQVSNEQAQLSCWNSMLDMLSVPGSDKPVPNGQVIIPEEEYDLLLMAQVQQEELDDAVENAELRFAQQQILLNDLQKELDDQEDNSAELERLKKETERVREAQKQEEIEEAELKARFKKRLIAREKKLSEVDEDE
jgi:hypothetical protein